MLYADSINLTPIADTTIHEAIPTNNFGGGASFTAGGRLQGGRARALLQFDITGNIPADATINSASLTLSVGAVNGPGSTFLIHSVSSEWGEGAGSDRDHGTTATAGEASWHDRLGPGTAWAVAGGDFAAPTNASQTVAGAGDYMFNSAALAADVQSWLNAPENNFGWLLRSEGEDTAGTIRRFAGRLDLNNPPRLAVDYTAPSPPLPPPPVLTDLALVGNILRFSFIAESNHTYAVKFRTALAGGDWGPLTNLPAFPADTLVHVTNALVPGERYFRVESP
jgi:hypothetical protein